MRTNTMCEYQTKPIEALADHHPHRCTLHSGGTR